MNNELILDDIPVNKNGETLSPMVSIVVLAYNHLEYTRQCVESIYRYSSHNNFELITVNNGSTDGTEEYFNSLPNTKKVSFPQNIGVCKAINQGLRLAKCKYSMNVSNDIVATTHWLDNLITCMETDAKIGMVVPICNASCNYQQLNIPYKTMDEIQRFAASYNISDPGKWEERLKLCTYAGIYRTEILNELGGFDEDFNPGCYDDDAICFSIRRMGYKVIFARDTFVHHYGACSFNEEYVKDNTLQMRNKLLFISKFGVDPYTAGLIDFGILDILAYRQADHMNILGVGSSYGTTLLQLKNTCRLYGCKNPALYYLSEWAGNMTELGTICDDCFYGSFTDIQSRFGARLYDYIVIESDSERIQNKQDTFSTLYHLLMPGGQIVCTAANHDMLYETMGIFYSLGAKFSKHINHYYLCFVKPD